MFYNKEIMHKAFVDCIFVLVKHYILSFIGTGEENLIQSLSVINVTSKTNVFIYWEGIYSKIYVQIRWCDSSPILKIIKVKTVGCRKKLLTVHALPEVFKIWHTLSRISHVWLCQNINVLNLHSYNIVYRLFVISESKKTYYVWF
jgi:hypothetical protein